MFFFFFFCFFSDQCCRDLFSLHARSSNPHLSTMPHPSSLTIPATPFASFTGTQVKICFFFLFFIPFLTNVTETLFTPHARTSNPCLSTTQSLSPCPTPQALQIPATIASPHPRRDL